MARFDDVQNIKCGHVKVLWSRDLEVLVEKAKNYESFAATSSFLAANPGGRVDSVAIIRSYMDARSGEDGDFLFTNFSLAKGGGVKCHNTPVTENNAVKCLCEGLTKSGTPGEKYTLHSLKTGSISEVRNSGMCSKSELRRHARLASRDMVDCYHNQSLEVKLRASVTLHKSSFLVFI